MDIQSSQIVWDFLSEYDINGELWKKLATIKAEREVLEPFLVFPWKSIINSACFQAGLRFG
jgi:hypothetical protein